MARAHVLLEDYQTIVHALKVNSPRYSKSPFKATWESEETVEDVGCSVQISSIAFGIATAECAGKWNSLCSTPQIEHKVSFLLSCTVHQRTVKAFPV